VAHRNVHWVTDLNRFIFSNKKNRLSLVFTGALGVTIFWVLSLDIFEVLGLVVFEALGLVLFGTCNIMRLWFV